MRKSLTIDLDTVLMNGIKEMIFVVKIGDHSVFLYEYFNQEVMEKTNLDESSLGKTFDEIYPKETADLLKEQYGKVLTSNAPVRFEDAYIASNGQRLESETQLTPLFDDNGKCTHIVGVVKDVTAEKQAERSSKEASERLEESHSRYRSLFNNNADAIFRLNLEGNIIGGNEAVEKISGYKLEELEGKNFFQLFSEKDSARIKGCFEKSLHEIFEDCRIKFSPKTGTEIGCLIKFIPIEIQGQVAGFFAVLKDMRELDKMVSKFVESEKRFRIIAESVHDVIVMMNHEGETTYVSSSSKAVYGVDAAEYIGKQPFFNVHPADIEIVKEVFYQSINERKKFKVEIRLKHKRKKWVWSEVKGTPVFDEQKRFIYMVTVSHDISMKKEHEEQLEYFAYHDLLTGLPNRRFFIDRLSERINQREQTGGAFALMILDIDYFKQINDRYGHEVGDEVLQEFANRLSGTLGEKHKHIVARMGGDEFTVLLSDIQTKEQAAESGEKIRQAFQEPWRIDEEELQITSSMGIAVSRPNSDIASLTRIADQAMYAAKKAGRDCYRVAIDN